MKILYVYAHPNPDSLNGMLQREAKQLLCAQHHEIKFTDLYASHFKAAADWNDFIKAESPTQYFLAQQQAFQHHALTADITTEIEKIRWADHVILQFPLWWFSTPAILKGWLDRVLVKGFAYDTGKVFNDGLLAGKTASLIVTTQSPESAYQTDGAHHATIDTFLHHIHHTMRFTGIQTFSPFVIYSAYDIENHRHQEILTNLHTYLGSLNLPPKPPKT